jgi:hypothetical protein
MATLSILPADQSSTDNLIKKIQDNIYAPLEGDQVIECVLLSTPSSVNMRVMRDIIGEPAMGFCGYNNQGTVCMLSGINYPVAKLSEMDKSIQEKKDRRDKAYGSKANFDDTAHVIESNVRKVRGDRRDIIAKYRKESKS